MSDKRKPVLRGLKPMIILSVILTAFFGIFIFSHAHGLAQGLRTLETGIREVNQQAVFGSPAGNGLIENFNPPPPPESGFNFKYFIFGCFAFAFFILLVRLVSRPKVIIREIREVRRAPARRRVSSIKKTGPSVVDLRSAFATKRTIRPKKQRRPARRIPAKASNSSLVKLAAENIIRKLKLNTHMLVPILILAAFISGVFYWQMGRDPRVAGIEEMIDVNIPEWYLEPLVVNRGENSLTITPSSGERVKMEREGDRYIYRNAYPHTDVAQTKYSFKIKEEMIFHEPGHPTEFNYEIGNIEAYHVEKDTYGNIVFYDKSLYEKYGGTNNLSQLFIIPAPFIQDSKNERSYAVTSKVEGNLFTITINNLWLKSAAYPVTLDPTIEISILNLHSHPQTGDDWIVDFTTVGEADLKIAPVDQATIDDDEFVSLSCDGEEREPEILPGDVIYYEDWNCEGVGRVIHKTLRAGKHTLKFDYGGIIAYAYNAAWYNTDWGWRKKLTVQSSQVTADISSFPVLATTTQDILKTSTNGGYVEHDDGWDILFTESDGITVIDYEREYYSSTTGELAAWIEVDVLGASNVDIYMYYGNSSISEDSATTTGVWDDNFKGVYHFGEDSGQHQDSTQYDNDSTSVTVTEQATSSPIGRADRFDGTDDLVSVPDDNTLDISNTGTIEAWIRTDDVSATDANFTDWRNDIDDPDGNGIKEYSGADMTIVGDTMYYAAEMCDGGANVFEVARSDLDGDNFVSWSAPGIGASVNCTSDEGGDIAIDSDGDYLYYAALGLAAGADLFDMATSTLDQSTFSAWFDLADPADGGASESGGIDMVIVGSKAYLAVLTTDGADETFSIANINLDGTGFSGWTAQTNKPDGAAAGEGCGIGIDSDGDRLYYAAHCHDGTTGQYWTSNSALFASPAVGTVAAWTQRTSSLTVDGDNHIFSDMAIVGDRAYHAVYGNTAVINNYNTASSSYDGSGFASAWISRQDGSGNPAGAGDQEGSSASITSDGKYLYYAALGADDDVETFNLASSTVTSHPIVSKASAYELVQSGGGYVFDWAGSPKTFGVSTNANNWYYVVITHDGSTMKYYINGVEKRTQNVRADFTNSANTLNIGGGDAYFDGYISEVRISDTARDIDYIQTSYNNQNNTSAFITYGEEEDFMTLTQSGYRFFENNNGTAVGSRTLGAENATTTLPFDTQEFRLRLLLHVGEKDFATGTNDLKLQYASTTAACQNPTGVWTDITANTEIAWKDNTSPLDGDLLTASTTADPDHGSDTVQSQTYEEANNFTSTTTIPNGDDGLWDFSLYNKSAAPSTVHCFRVLRDNDTALTAYNEYPALVTPPLALTQSSYRWFENIKGPEGASDIGSATIDTSTSSTATGYSFQRKTWYDGTRYWAGFHDDYANRIEFWYSENGSTWSENTAARIAVDTNDFSIEADSNNAFIAYTNGYDVEAKHASSTTSYPGTGFSWGASTTVFDGSGGVDTDSYYYPTIATGTDGKIMVNATNYIFTCGEDITDIEANSYGTVAIGNQCWMEQGLNVGTRISTCESGDCSGNCSDTCATRGTSLNEQDNDSQIEKYCYNDTDANCDSNNNPNYPDGGLYQWAEAMALTSSCNSSDCSGSINSPHQGICPDGWHIPTDEEIKTLEGTVDSTYPVGDSEWDLSGEYRGDDAATNLKPNGSSGWEGNLAGNRRTTGYFHGRTTYGNFWSSSQYGTANAWHRALDSSRAGVYRYFDTKAFGFSVRCLKD